MAQHSTHKTGSQGKATTLARRQTRATKYGVASLTRSAHVKAVTK